MSVFYRNGQIDKESGQKNSKDMKQKLTIPFTFFHFKNKKQNYSDNSKRYWNKNVI